MVEIGLLSIPPMVGQPLMYFFVNLFMCIIYVTFNYQPEFVNLWKARNLFKGLDHIYSKRINVNIITESIAWNEYWVILYYIIHECCESGYS